jgi:RNA polymerase sigma factor (sigma-70 family)
LSHERAREGSETDVEAGGDAEIGDQQLLETIERHVSLLRSYVRLRAGPLLRSREALSDIVQSTLRELLEDARGLRFESEAAVRSWLYKVATHKIISKQRYHAAERRNPERELALSDEMWDLPERDASSPSRSPTRQLVRLEELELLQRAFDELDDEDRQILAMRRFFDLPTAVIAAELGLAESTVRGRLGRIQAELASRLA